MTADQPLDLSILGDGADRAAQRISASVMARVRVTREDGVTYRLGRWLLPTALAAAASIALALALLRRPEPKPDLFALVALRHTPARGWVAYHRAPELHELVNLLQGGAGR
jgi:hypothetical protein